MNEKITPEQLRLIAQEAQDKKVKAVLSAKEQKAKEEEEWLNNAISVSLKTAQEAASSGEQRAIVVAIDQDDIKYGKRKVHMSISELRQVQVGDLIGKKQKLVGALSDMGFSVGLTIERAYEDPYGGDNPYWHEPYLQLTISW